MYSNGNLNFGRKEQTLRYRGVKLVSMFDLSGNVI